MYSTFRPEFLGVLVWKETRDTKVGIVVAPANDGSLRLSRIHRDEGLLLQHAPFEFGDKLHSINGQSCQGLTARESMELVRATTGWLSVAVQNVGGNPHLISATVCTHGGVDQLKSTSTGTGVSLRQRKDPQSTPRQQEGSDILYIAGLQSGGIFGFTLLQVGDQLVSINANDCRRAQWDARAALRRIEDHLEASSYVTLVAVRALSLPPLSSRHRPRPAWTEVILFNHTLVTDKITTTGSAVGISLKDNDDKLYISNIDPCGLLANGPFHFGDQLCCINQKSCQGMSVEEAMAILEEQGAMEGPLSIVVYSEGGEDRFVATKVYKAHKVESAPFHSDVGMSLERKRNNATLCISRLDQAAGLFATSALLTEGDEVISVNTVDCTRLDAGVVLRAIQDEPHAVVIVAQKKSPILLAAAGAAHESEEYSEQARLGTSPQERVKDRPEFLQVVVWKERPDVSVGLSLKMGHDKTLRISHIYPNGLVAKSPLQYGDKVHRINNQSCEGLTAKEAVDLMRNATGRLSIVIRNVGGNTQLLSVCVSRQPEAWRSIAAGVSLKQTHEGSLCILGIHRSGLFSQTVLQIGDHVRLINDFDCRGDVDCRSAIRMMNDEEANFATIVVARKQALFSNPSSRPETIEAILWKANAGVDVGISFTKANDGYLQISSLDPCGLLSDSPICYGDKILSINNQSCQYMTEEQAMALVSEVSGALSLVVHNVNGDSRLLTCMVQKPTAESSPGISLESTNEDENLYISEFYAFGLFAQSSLNVGDQVLSVNNENCAGCDVEAVMKTIVFEPFSLVITVKKHVGPVHVDVDPILSMRDDMSYAATVIAEVEKEETSIAEGYAQITLDAPLSNHHHTAPLSNHQHADFSSGMAPAVQAVATSEMIPDDLTIFALDGTRTALQQAIVPSIENKEDPLDRPEFLGVTLWKEEENIILGISVTQAEDESLRIIALDPNGLLGKSPFQFADRLHSIQNQSCEGMSAEGALKMMRQTVGWLSIVVHNVGGDPSTVAAMVTKRTPDERVGISLKKRGNALTISGIDPSGLFVHSLLNIGDEVLNVNGVDCRRHRDVVPLAIRTIQEAPVEISIIAMAAYNTGIVVSVEDYDAPEEEESGILVAVEDGGDVNNETNPADPTEDINDTTLQNETTPEIATQGCCILL